MRNLVGDIRQAMPFDMPEAPSGFRLRVLCGQDVAKAGAGDHRVITVDDYIGTGDYVAFTGDVVFDDLIFAFLLYSAELADKAGFAQGDSFQPVTGLDAVLVVHQRQTGRCACAGGAAADYPGVHVGGRAGPEVALCHMLNRTHEMQEGQGAHITQRVVGKTTFGRDRLNNGMGGLGQRLFKL